MTETTTHPKDDRKFRDTTFGKVLRLRREKAGLSQEGLAFASNLDRSYISLLERGMRSPSLNTLFALAQALESTTAEIVETWEKDLILFQQSKSK